ncbi:MAG: hypothetical protein ACOX3P_00835 [Saccharofermentanales bacterium]|jgi:hypothetical protein|nr:hypothetical protein [Bacillota bacterium]NLB08196.1 hypothetical protein [Clostridiales bacterium]
MRNGFATSITDMFNQALQSLNLTNEILKTERSKKNDYLYYRILGRTVAKIHYLKTTTRLEVPKNNLPEFKHPLVGENKVDYLFVHNFPQDELHKIISDIVVQSTNTLGPDPIGCCSKYVQCSDAKKCLCEDIEIKLSCYYRKNLEAGKIFYGVNKNI